MDQVLTRKDQLNMKEKKKEDMKSAKEEKKAKSKARGKAKSKVKAKGETEVTVEDEVEMEDMEVEAEKKPRRRLKKMNTMDVAPVEDPPGDLDSAPAASKPGRRTKPAANPKVAAKAKAKQEPKRKAKAKAKAVAKSAGDGCGDGLEVDESMARTPENTKKSLFQSDDDGDDDESFHERYDRKSRSVMPLRDILEQEEPTNHRKRQRGKAEPSQSAASKEEPENKPAKKKRKQSKEKGIKKVDLSPFTKKEKNRRQKAEKEVMQQPATPDAQIQGICLQHLKNVAGLTFEDVKAYLRDKLRTDRPKDFKIDEYWGRMACGVKVRSLGDGSMKNAPEIVYFKAYGTAPKGWNLNMALVYVSASLLVPKLIHFVFWELLELTI